MFRSAQAEFLAPVTEALKKLEATTDWSGAHLVAENSRWNWKTAPLKHYVSFEDFYNRELRKTWGEWARLQAIYEKKLNGASDTELQPEIDANARAAQTMAAAVPVAAHGGAREDAGRKSKTEPKVINQGDNITLKTPSNGIRGTSKEYLAGLIKRDRPDVAADVEAGKYPSIRAAALAAGIIKYRVAQFNPDNPDQIARQLKKHCSASVIENLKLLLNGEAAAGAAG
jgi:hypothetical protein